MHFLFHDVPAIGPLIPSDVQPISNLQLTPARLSLSLHARNADKLSLEDEHRVGRDGAHSSGAVARLGLNCEQPLLARAHAQDTLVPALDHLALADVERQRLAALVGLVEFRAVGLESAAVVDVDFVACLGFSICSNCGCVAIALTLFRLPGALDRVGNLDVERLVERGDGAEEERER